MAIMPPPEVVEALTLRSIDIDRDAEKLARMWNDSDDQWPGTWNRGVLMTAERVRDWHMRQKAIDVLIWDTGDAIAGYCSLWEYPEEANVTYIATLNVAPQFQKRSLARKFLTHYVERVIGLGSRRLDLHTWPGNLKAVPLYKKCGFFWMPGTAVHMFNFLPAILTMPLARPFFARHEWYTSFKRELTQTEDDERWEGMTVFTYRFEAEGEQLTVWCDREARAITAIETDELFAAAIAGSIAPPRGLPATMRWRLTNKRDRPMTISLIANGTPDLALDYRATLQLPPGETTTLEASVEIAATARDPGHEQPAPAIRSLLVIDGQLLELSTGMRPRAAVEISTYPEQITLTPGVEQEVRIQLRSHLGDDVEASLSLAPQPGLTAGWTQRGIALPAGDRASLPVVLRAEEGGVFELPIAIAFDRAGQRVHLPVKTEAIFALPVGGVLGALVDGKLRIENETLRLELEQEGAGLTISSRSSGRELLYQHGYAAPPTWPSEYRSGKFALSLERQDGQLIAVATLASREHPGFVLRRRISVNAGPVCRIDYDFENLGAEQRRFQLMQGMGGDRNDSTTTLPLAAGLAQGPADVFPGSADDTFKRADAYAERWAAITSPHATIGVIWADDMEEIEWTWGLTMLTRFYDCPPQSRVQPGPFYLMVGDGDWRMVQRLWRRLAGQPSGAPHPQPRAPIAARLSEAAITAGGAAQATLLVENLMSRAMSGTVTLELPEGWRTEATRFDVTEISWQRPFEVDLHLTGGSIGAFEGRIALRSSERDASLPLPLIRVGDERAVAVRQGERAGQPVLTIANGRIEIDITPQFSATVSAIRENGAELLASPFPNVATRGWMSPWYGGIMPVMLLPGTWDFPGKLWQEVFVAEEIALRDRRGISWRGVRQRAALTQERTQGLILEIDTLTLGGSPVIQHTLRLINPTPIARKLDAFGLLAFVQPGGQAAMTLWGAEQQLKPSDRIGGIKTGHWAAAEDPATGRAIALIAPRPEVTIVHWGLAGGHLELLTPLSVPAGETIEVASSLALADDLEEARRYAALKEL